MAFLSSDFITTCIESQVVDNLDDALQLGANLLRHGIILNLYGTREFKNKKKIFRFYSDHRLLHFDSAAGGSTKGRPPINCNCAVFQHAKRFTENTNIVVSKIQELHRKGVESVSLSLYYRLGVYICIHEHT